MKLELKNSLSVKLLRVVLLSALIVGVALSVAQIVFDAYKTRQAVADDAQRILDMFRDPSTQAVYSLDRVMGMQVIEGLFQDDAVRMASIGHPNETMLAEKSRALQQSPSRWLTDLILGQERTFTTPLVGKGPYSEYYGVVKAINFVAGEATPNTTDFESLRKGLDRQFNVGYVESVTGKDAKLIRDKTGNILSMTYEVRKPFLYNIDFVVKFSHAQPLGSKTAGD